MIRKALIAMACAAPLLTAATPAMAIPTGKTFGVYFEGDQTGSWNLRNLVVDQGNYCLYTVKWTDLTGPPIGRTVLCKIQEEKAGDDFDCETMRHDWFDTLVQKGGACQGVDDFGQIVSVKTLIAGENSGGSLNGVIVVASTGDVQNFSVQ